MRLLKLSFLLFIFLIINQEIFSQYNNVVTKGDKLYLANTVVLKLKNSVRQSSKPEISANSGIMNQLQKEGALSANYLFNKITGSETLDNIMIVNYSSRKDPEEFSTELLKNADVEWCEPKFVYELSYVPNDTDYTEQYNLNKIFAEQAWDITQGDTSIVIGIIDTGVDWDHPDLAANIWVNRDEVPDNGVDDDNNGHIDDIRGWDFGGLTGTPDNDPMEDQPDHGTHVAGIASAVTNNTTGIAGIGFNSRIMPVKASIDDFRNSSNQPYIVFGYEGIVYAVDNGAKVVNVSWGGSGYSLLGQSVVNYAVANGVVVVGAAGNGNSNLLHYPSAYDGVLSVASTDAADKRSSFSNYGATVDVTAPGSAIYSTWQNNDYLTISGTSMSSPLAAGLAALVITQFPSYNALQIIEQIRVNADDISDSNIGFDNWLGKGRINAVKAVSNSASVSVRGTEFIFSDEAGDNDGILEPGETITISAEFTNFLNPTGNLTITLESLTSVATVINGNFNAGAKGTLEIFNNAGSEFQFSLRSFIPNNYELSLKVNYTDGTYTDFQIITVRVNPSFADQTNGTVLLTIGSDGTLGFIDMPSNTQGSGFKYMEGDNLLFEGALIIGTSSKKISDAARGGETRNHDFSIVTPFTIAVPGEKADQQGYAVFRDDPAIDKIGVTVHLNSYSYSNIEDDDYILFRYTLVNNTTAPIANLYAGLFLDWDIEDATSDITTYDSDGQFGYAYRSLAEFPTWVGAASGDVTKGGFYAIMNDGSMGDVNLFDADEFSDAEKWKTISSGVGVQNAGPGDVSHVVSNGPYEISPGASVEVPFIIAAGNNQEELRVSVNNARLKYASVLVDAEKEEQLPVEYNLSQNYPNPFNPSTRIEFSLPEQQNVVLKIFNILGEEAAVILNKELPSGSYKVNFNPSDFNLAGGVYLYSLKAGEFSSVKKMVYLK
jgi:serine protease